MSNLILIGIILLFVVGFLSLISVYFSIKNNNSYILIFNIIALIWVVVSIFYRLNTDQNRVRFFILCIGPILAGISYIWGLHSIYYLKINYKKLKILYVAVAFSLFFLTFFFAFSEIITNVHSIDSGLYRYNLSFAGNILFSFSFLIIFLGILIQFIKFKNLSFSNRLACFLMVLSLFGVIFPWKELALNVVFISISGFFLAIGDKIKMTHSIDEFQNQ